MKTVLLSLFIIVCVLLVGCPQLLIQSDQDQYIHTEIPTEFITAQFTGDNTESQQITTKAPADQVRTIQLTVHPGEAPVSSLFFQFTNTSGSVTTVPKVRIVGGANNIVQTSRPQADISNSSSRSYSLRSASHAHEIDIPQPLHIAADPLSIPLTAPRYNSTSVIDPPTAHSTTSVALGSSRAFRLHLTGTTERLYARAIRTIGDWSVVIWVHPAVFEGCSGSYCLSRLLTQSDITDIMDVFLKSGSNNDIFDWVTKLTGPPWGEHNYDGDGNESNQLISGDVRTINLILTDIGRAGYEPRTVVGYFSPGDTTVSSENKSLMVYLHAPWAKYDTTESQRRDIFYYYFLSALAHEFQHLVHFYQRTLLFDRGPQSLQDPTWLNEQYSLMIEDILSQNIIGSNINGLDDRGVNGTSAGTYPVCHGRLPDFAAQSYYGISRWGRSIADNEPFINYAVNYSFGNFLLRNYNGSAYLERSYDHNGDPIATIEAGLNGEIMADAVTKWGTAILLSDTIHAPLGYKLNNGERGFIFEHNNISYSLGSTNYFNYGSVDYDLNCDVDTARGIFTVYNDTERLYYQSGDQQHGHSNIFYEAGTDFNGEVRFVITLPVASRLSIVAKRQRHEHNPVYF